jgi:hypothetical protein
MLAATHEQHRGLKAAISMTPPPTQQVAPPPTAAQPKIAPAMPRIPGVSDAPKAPRFDPKPFMSVALILAVCAAVFSIWLWHQHHGRQEAAVPAQAIPEPVLQSQPPIDKSAHADSDAIGTLDELTQPWAYKRFGFVDPKTHESVPAMVIHIPSSGGHELFWAFSLNTPFSQCELQYVTDVAALSQRYAYPVAHPMLVSACDGTLYDPLKMSTLPDGSWVRGEIVRGGGIRPPIAIQVHVRGRVLVADRIE